VTLGFAERGLVVKPIDVEVMFTGVLVFRPGTPHTETARQFMRHMRMQLERDQKALRLALGAAATEEDEAAVRKRNRRPAGGVFPKAASALRLRLSAVTMHCYPTQPIFTLHKRQRACIAHFRQVCVAPATDPFNQGNCRVNLGQTQFAS
jgi:hypothetical protein